MLNKIFNINWEWCNLEKYIQLHDPTRKLNIVTRKQRTQRLVLVIFYRVISRDNIKPKRSENDEGL